MSLLKIHKVIPWKNRTEPAINEKNLSQIDNELDTLDDRIICLDTTKLSSQTAGNFITNVEINSTDGVITVTYYSGRTVTYDTNLKKIPINYRFDEETQILYFIADDGTEQICNLSSLISQYEFADSSAITFAIDAAGQVTADIKRGSITEDLLQPNFLADVRVEAAKAISGAEAAEISAMEAAGSAKIAQNYGEAVQDIYQNIQAGSVTGVKGAKEDVFRRGDVVITPENIGALPVDGDSTDNTVSFTSTDAVSPAGWTDVPVLESGGTHSSLFSKISTMVKNIRWLYKILGSTDITGIGNSTVTGAIQALNSLITMPSSIDMPISFNNGIWANQVTESPQISDLADMTMESTGGLAAAISTLYSSLSALNLKTYTTLNQLGFTEPTTTAEVYAAMPSQSQALFIDTVVTDLPTDGGGATALFVKQSTHRGFILAAGKTNRLYIMHLNGAGGNPTGVWIPIPMYTPGKIKVFATPVYYAQVDGKYEWSVAVNSPVFPADSTKIAVTALDIYGIAYITSPSYEIIENNGSGSLLIKFMFDNQHQGSTWRIYFEIS